VEERRKLGNEHTRQVQVLIYWLKQIFPQILGWFDEMSSPLVGDLLKRWPELPKLQKASKKTLRTFFQQHNCRSEERIQQRLDAIGLAVPATTDAALLRAGNLCIQLLVQMLTNLRAGIAEFDSQIEAIYQTHPDRLITASLPGAGRRWSHGCWQPWGLTASVSPLPPTWLVVSASPRSRKVVERPAGFTGVGPVPNSCGRPFMNGRTARFGPAAGPANTTISSASKARAITPAFAPLPSNGFVSSSAAGETVCPTPSSAICKPCASLTPRHPRRRRLLPPPPQSFPPSCGNTVEIFRKSLNFPLDGITQMSHGRGSVGGCMGACYSQN
jgi:hypothetical protein